MDARSQKRSPVVYIFLALLAFGLACSLLLNAVLVAGSLAGRGDTRAARKGQGEDEFPRLREHWSFGSGEVKVVRIAVEGVIMRGDSGGLFGPPGDKIERILAQIRAATADRAVRGVIVEVDSPGGAVSPSDEIYQALRRFRESREDRRVLAVTRDMAASGGYYVAVAADWIVAEPTAVVGSIGVIMQALNWKELSDRVGVTATTIKSGANKDLLNPFSEVQPGQVDLLQVLIDDMYDRFRGIVAERRSLGDDALSTLADGRVFPAGAALEHKLVDQLGYWDDAVARMAELLDEPAVRVVRYSREVTFRDLFAQAQPVSSLAESLGLRASPEILYLWKP